MDSNKENNFQDHQSMLSARKAARLLKCAPDYIGKLCREGKLDGVRVKNAWFVSKESLKRFEETRELAKAQRASSLAQIRRQEIAEYRKQKGFIEQTPVTPKTSLSAAYDQSLSARKAARLLKCAPDYIGKLCREGKLDGVRVKNAWFVSKESLKRFEETRELAKAQRASSLAQIRRQESEQYRKQNNIPRTPKRISNPFSSGVLAFSTAFVLLLGIYASANTAPHLFGSKPISRTLSAAIGEINSPFFGTTPLQVTLSSDTFSIPNIISSLASAKDFLTSFFAFLATQHTPVALGPSLPEASSTPSQTPIVLPPSSLPPVQLPPVAQSTSTTPIIQNITYPVIERTVVQSGITQDDLTAQLQALADSLRQEINANVASTPSVPYSGGGFTNSIALTGKIDTLSNVTLNNVTVNGIDSNVAVTGSISATEDLNVGGHTTLNTASSTELTTSGPTYLSLASGNTQIATTTAQSTLAVSGNASIGADYGVAAPTNGLIVEGNVGIGTTSPFTTFAVQGNGYFSGNLTAANFTATGTTALLTASTSQLSVFQKAYFGATATSTFDSLGDFALNGTFSQTPAPRTASTSTQAPFLFTGAADTGLTGEAPDVQFNDAQTKTFANSTIPLQRAFLINAPTEAFASYAPSNNFADLATLAVTGAPITAANGNGTTTNAHTLYLGSSTLNASTTNSYGLTVNANTGAVNNYAAEFLGGNVGIGTTSPFTTLAVNGGAYIGGAVSVQSLNNVVYCDQYPSLPACIAAVPATGGTVVLPPNTTYVLSATLTVSTSNLTIRGGGFSTVIQRGPTMTGKSISLEGVNDKITDLTIDGNGSVNPNAATTLRLFATSTSADHIQIINSLGSNIAMFATDTEVTNSTITGYSSSAIQNYGIWAINGAPGVVIDHNTITNTGIDGIGANGADLKVTNNYLAGNHCYTGIGGGQLVIYGANGAVISNNTIDKGCANVSSGMELNGNNLDITGNVIQNQQWMGITLQAGTHHVISGNIIRDSGQSVSGPAIVVDPGISDFQITSNRLIDDQTTPTQNYGISISAGSSDYYIITDNDLSGNVTAPLLDGGTGIHKNISGNLPLSVNNILPASLSVATSTNPFANFFVSGNAAIGADYNVAGPTNGLLVEGNVGIGTTSPFSSLSVAGNEYLAGNLTATNITATGTLTVSGQTTLTTASTTQLTVSGNTWLATTGGNVGIGTTSPFETLSVNGSGYVNGDLNANNFIVNGTNGYTLFGGDQGGRLELHGLTNTSQPYFDIANGNHDYDFRYQFTPASNLLAISASSTTNILNLLGNGNVGIGTSSPFTTFGVAGNSYLSGNVTLGNSTGNTLTVNALISSTLQPNQNDVYDIGSPSYFWRNGYFNNLNVNSISAASTSISGTVSSSFTINSANNTPDTQDSSLIFYRGTVQPNAVLSWNSTAKRFEFNQPVFIQNQSTSTGNVITLNLEGLAGQTADLFDVASSSGAMDFNVTAKGNVGIGTSSPFSTLSVAGNEFLGGNLTATGTLNVTGQTTLTTASTTQLTVSGDTWLAAAGGVVGINNTTPTYTLDVGGDTNISAGFSYRYNGAILANASTTLDNYFFGGAGNLTQTGNSNTAIGLNALFSNTTGSENTANGVNALSSNTTGGFNLAEGYSALHLNTTGGGNTALGGFALHGSVTGSNNVGIGDSALYSNVSATNTVAIGVGAAQGTANYANQGATVIGYEAGNDFQTGSDYNTLLGYQSGFGITTGARNVLIGQSTIAASYNQVTTGSNNIAIGNDVAVPSATASNQLDIGNFIYGTGLSGTGSTVSNGLLGIGTTSPFTTLAVAGSGYFSGNLTATNITATGTLTVSGQTTLTTASTTQLTVSGDTWLAANAGSGVVIGSTGIPFAGLVVSSSTSNANGALGAMNPLAVFTGGNTNNRLEFGVDNSGATAISFLQSRNTISGAQYLSLNPAGGNVGIGTTNPGDKLSINTTATGTDGISLTSNVWGGNLGFEPNMGSGNTNPIVQNGDSAFTFSSSAGKGTGNLDITPWSANVSGLRIEGATGYVGISNTNPAYTLDVSGYINTDQYSGYKQAGNTILYASTTNTTLAVGPMAASWANATSTPFADVAVGIGALNTAPTSNIATGNTAIGYNAIHADTTGHDNTALGWSALVSNTSGSSNTADSNRALYNNTTGSSNTAIGESALFNNISGSDNTANGLSALVNNTIGSNNTGVGLQSLGQNVTGDYNVAEGYNALYQNQSATNTVAIGALAAQGSAAYSNQGVTAIGFQAGANFLTGSDYNTLLGYQSGFGITTGARNVLIGQSTIAASYNQVTTGSNNIAIGNDVAVPSATASNQLDIGNFIYGTGLSGTGSTVSNGLLGIGTTSPQYTLDILANNTFKGLRLQSNTDALVTLGSNSASSQFWTYGASSNTSGQGSNLFFVGTSDANGGSISQKLTINSSGNVGIGTTSPNAKLTVNGEIATNSGGAPSGASGSTLSLFYDKTNDQGTIDSLNNGVAWKNLKFEANAFNFISGASLQGLYQDSSGRVGVGTSTLGTVGTTTTNAALTVNGNLYLSGSRSTIFTEGDNNIAHVGGLQMVTYDNGGHFILTPTLPNGTPENGTIDLGGFGNFNSNTVGLAVSGALNVTGQTTLTTASTTQLTVSGDTWLATTAGTGVSIGNTAPPTYTLDVTGSVRSTSYFYNSSTNLNQIALNSAGSNYGQIGNYGTGEWYLGYGTSPQLLGTEVLDWNTAGQVGIGTTSPSGAKVAIDGGALLVTQGDTGNGGKFLLGSGAQQWQILGNDLVGRDLQFVTSGGTSVLSLLQSNNSVGIDNYNPQYTLDVGGYINTDQYSGYKQNGNTILYASTTNQTLTIGDLAAPWANATSSAFFDTAVGYGALQATPTTGLAADNTALGNGALNANTAGFNNTALGYGALTTNSSGSDNTATGMYALIYNTTGSDNNATGFRALSNNTTGSYNTVSGFRTMYSNITGSENTAEGYQALFYNQSATNTVAVGFAAGQGTANYSNQDGTYLGYAAGYSAQTGSSNNTLVGFQSGYGITSGQENTLLGASVDGSSYNQLTTGNQNIAIGFDVALPSQTANGQLDIGNEIYGTGLTGTGSTLSTGNIGIGTTTPQSTLDVEGGSLTVSRGDSANVGGTINVGYGGYQWKLIGNQWNGGDLMFRNPTGKDVLYFSQTGGNVGIDNTSPNYALDVAGYINTDQYSGYKQAGNTVLYASTTNGTLAVGPYAAPWANATSTVFYDTAIGQGALGTTPTNANATYNTAVGFNALTSNTTGYSNSAFGMNALQHNTTGYQNTAVGLNAFAVNTTGYQTVAVGMNSLINNTTGYQNTAIGMNSLLDNTTGYMNVAEGISAMTNNTTGYDNTAIGPNALYTNTTGFGNTAEGFNSLYANTTGEYNVGIGQSALTNNITGINDTAIGVNTFFYNQSATTSVAVGAYAAQGSANYSNAGGTYVGYQSGFNAQTNSDYNTFLGMQSGFGATTGAENVLIGASPDTASYNQLTTGNQNIAIGYDVALPSQTASGQLNIGNEIYGTGLTGTGSTLSTGNIGIGTTTPQTKLAVVGTGYFSGNVGIGGVISPFATLQVHETTNQNVTFLANDNSSDPGASGIQSINDTNTAYEPLGFVASQYYFGFGDVGIGTTTPAYKLDVSGYINTDKYSGYKQDGSTILYASTTNQTLTVGDSAAPWANATSSVFRDVAIGYQALNATPTSGAAQDNTALGYDSLLNDKTGYENTALGSSNLENNDGTRNTAVGYGVDNSNTTGSNNIGIGFLTMGHNITGNNNIGLGFETLINNQSATNTTAIGYASGLGNAGNYSNQGGTYVGYDTGYNLQTGSDYNTLMGFDAGFSITTGADNILIGPEITSASYNQLTTGNQNISIGYNIALPSQTANGQLDIGNEIYGTGLTGTGSTLSTGNIGIGTTTPAQTLEVVGGGIRSSGSAPRYELLDTTVTGDNINEQITFFDGSGAKKGLIGYQSSDDLKFQNNYSTGGIGFNVNGSTQAMYINSSGDVGIGSSSPAFPLSVNGGGYINGVLQANEYVVNGTNGYTLLGADQGAQLELHGLTGTSQPYFDIANGSHDYDFRYQLLPASNVLSIHASTTANQLVLSGNGTVGIGTANPTYPLDVTGEIHSTTDFYASTATANSQIALNSSGTDYGQIGTNASQVWYLGYGTNRSTVGTPVVEWNNSGNVGIGTSTPQFALDVQTGGNAGDIRLGLTCSSNYSGINLNGLGSASDCTNYNILSSYSDQDLYINRPTGHAIHFRMNNSDQLTINSAGNAVFSGDIQPSVNSNTGGGGWSLGGGTWGGNAPATTNVNSVTGLAYAGGAGSQLFTLSSGSGQASLQLDGSVFIGDGISYNPASISGSTDGSLDASGSGAFGGDLYTNGNFHLAAANPTIYSGGSYITIPNGLYVSGGTPYFQNQIQARGGIHNDNATYLELDGGTSSYTYVNGNLGIGTTAPGEPLDVAGIGRFVSPNSGSTGGVIIRDAAGNPNGDYLQFVNNADNSEYADIRGLSGGGLALNGGNVGIGTSSPSNTLSVNGGAYFTGNVGIGVSPSDSFDVVKNGGTGGTTLGDFASNDTWGSVLQLENNSTNGHKWQFFLSGTNATVPAGSFSILDLTQSSADRFTINSAGNVGINNSNPGYNLQVGGTGYFSGCLYANGSGCLSDQRVKTNIQSFGDGLSEVSQLNPVTYYYNGLAGTPTDGVMRYGLIAQNTLSVAPDLVYTTYQKLNPTDATTTELYGINYNELDFVLINATKQMNDVYVATNASTSQPTIQSFYQGTTIPAITVDSRGDVAIGTTTASSTPFASTFTVVGSGCFSQGTGATINCGNTPGNIYYKTANAGNYDVAENYQTTDSTLTPGTIVAVDPINPMMVTTATTSTNILGVVSTAPGLVLGGSDASSTIKHMVPIGLVGRVPVQVITAGGAIAVGDRIMLSTTPGVGMKAGPFDPSVGIALEAVATSTGTTTVDVFVNPQPGIQGSQIAALVASSSATSSVQTILNDFSSASAAFQQALSQALNGVQGLAQTGVRELGVAVHASVGVFDSLFAQTITTDTIYAQKLCLGSTCITETQLQALLAGTSATSTSTTSGTSTTTTPLTITVNGNNPATVTVGSSYIDLGATVSDSAYPNIGYVVSVDGGATTTQSNVVVDTSTTGSHTILYSVTDPAGNTASATRIVDVVSSTSSTTTSSTPTSTTTASSSPTTTSTATTTATSTTP